MFYCMSSWKTGNDLGKAQGEMMLQLTQEPLHIKHCAKHIPYHLILMPSLSGRCQPCFKDEPTEAHNKVTSFLVSTGRVRIHTWICHTPEFIFCWTHHALFGVLDVICQLLSVCLCHSKNKNSQPWRLVQDGRSEGRALTPSCESTEITTNCWTIVDRKTLELTKNDTPLPKTKEKPQWDGRRGAITIKSNPITAGWVTHKLENTYTTEVHPLEWRFSAPRQASELRGPAMGGGIPRESDFEG